MEGVENCISSLNKFLVAWGKLSGLLYKEFKENVTRLNAQHDRISSEVNIFISGRDEFYFDSENGSLARAEHWLGEADSVIEKARRLENAIDKNMNCLIQCLHMKRQYRLIDEVEMMTTDIIRLLEAADAIKIDPPNDPTPFFLSNSFVSAFEKIVKALKNDGVRMIAVWGMAGVGKTTLIERVEREITSFGKVIVVHVSPTADIKSIQNSIATTLDHKMETFFGKYRAEELCSILKKEPKVVVILDDVWTGLNLDNIGIPRHCKIILTTRRKQVCIEMRVQEVIPLDLLSDAEACDFLQDKTTSGHIVNGADELVQECQGLPLAMVNLGGHWDPQSPALEEAQSAIRSWWTELRSPRLILNGECLEALKNTCLAIRSSYEFLKKQSTTKKCFLLCCLLFPHDSAIDEDVLTRYAWGMQLYENIDSFKNARCEVKSAIETLIDSSLLLHHEREGVKMHKLVRYCALWIASQEKVPFMMKGLDEIVSKDENLRDVSENPEILLLDGGCSQSRIISSSTVFEGLKSLKVLTLRDGHLSAGYLQALTNLRSLHLVHCQGLDDISSLRKLQKLEILSFHGSDISKLPDDITELNRLRLLDLWDCQKLQKLPLDFLLKFSQLEELLFNFLSFEEWWFGETGSAVMGSSLEIEIKSDASQDNPMSINLRVRANIVSMLYEKHHNPVTLKGSECSELKEYSESRCIRNQLPAQVNLQITDLTVTDGDELTSLFSFYIAQSMVNLKKLKINACNELEKITSEVLNSGCVKVIYSDSPCLPSLETLEINRCKKLEFVFPITTASVAPKLNELKIVDCPLLTCVFDVGKDGVALDNLKQVSLEGLKQVSLEGLDGFTNFFSGRFSIPSLETLQVRECPQLTTAISGIIKGDELKRLSLVKVGRKLYEELFQLQVGCFLSSLKELEVEEIHELRVVWKDPYQIISLQNLTCLKVIRCNNLKYIFSVQLARNLPQLIHIQVRECEEMEQLFCNDQEALSMASQIPTYFPYLEVIHIIKCNKLEYLFPLCVSHLPKLKELQMEEACKLTYIFEPEVEVNNKNNEQEVNLPELKKLSLQNLDKFVAFGSRGFYFVFPSLPSLQVTKCPRRVIDFFYDSGKPHVRTKIEIDNNHSNINKKIGESPGADICMEYKENSNSYEPYQV